MYFIELLVKKLRKKKKDENSFNPLEQENFEDEEHCEHIFMPIDSSGETFACSKCGLVIDKKTYERRNFGKAQRDCRGRRKCG